MMARLMKAPMQTGFLGFGRRLAGGAGGRLSTSIAAAAEDPSSWVRDGPAVDGPEEPEGPAPFAYEEDEA